MKRAIASMLLAAGLTVIPTALAPASAIDPPGGLRFGTVPVGATKTQTLTFSVAPQEARDVTVQIIDGSTGGPSSDFTHTTTCPAVLPAGSQTCTVAVTFRPRAAKSVLGVIAIGGNSGGTSSAQAVQLTGTGGAAKKSCKKKGKKGAAAAGKKKGCKKK